ncbi:MAG: hypothetical protein DMG55_00375 [Acidobacteria bacterium]|nr:MAG: hypothetical protein DMG55_00375 [Acidobacteriota bacterium]
MPENAAAVALQDETREETHGQLSAQQTLLLILLPMLPTFVCVRLYLHLLQVRHFCPRGVLAHHRFLECCGWFYLTCRAIAA